MPEGYRIFENLDKIDWKNLSHAYGEATDVPELIKDLVSENKADRNNALYGLYGNIYHQGTVYEATSYAIPFLIEILENNLPVSSEILNLLDHIINGYSKNDKYIKAIEEEFGKGFMVFTNFLTFGTYQEKYYAAYILSCFKDKKKEVMDLLMIEFRKTDNDPALKSIFTLCMGKLLEENSEIFEFYEKELLKSDYKLVKLAVILTYIKIHKNNLKEPILINLKALLDNKELFLKLQRYHSSQSMTHENMLYYLKGIKEDQLKIIIKPLVNILKEESDGNNCLDMANALIQMAFKENNEKNPIKSKDELNTLQKEILIGFVESPGVWEYANIYSDLKRAGINFSFKLLKNSNGSKYLSYRRGLADFLGVQYFDPQEKFNEAILFKENKEFKKAFDIFKELISSNSEIPEYYHCAGHMKILQNERKEAVPYLNKALEIYLKFLEKKPNNAELLFWIAAVYSLLRDKSNSFKFLKKAIKINHSYLKKAANEEDFNEYHDDEDFIKLITPKINFKKIERINNKPANKDYTKEEIETINLFSEKLDKAKWQEAKNWNRTFNDFVKSEIEVNPPAFGRYFGENANLEAGLNFDNSWYIQLLIGSKNLKDSVTFRFYYKNDPFKILNLLIEKQENLDLNNYLDDFLLKTKELCREIIYVEDEESLFKIE